MGANRPPNFFIPGTQKAGTTFLYKNLRRHPDIFFSKDKEPHFFSKHEITKDEYEQYLQKNFGDTSGEQWIGEASALYLHAGKTPQRIREFVGADVRFIICLRHPVEKAISLYVHNYRRGRLAGFEHLSYRTDKGLCPSLHRGLYFDACRRYVECFGRERVLILFFDDLQADPASYVNAALSFLGLEMDFEATTDRVNAGLPIRREGEYVVVETGGQGEAQVVAPMFRIAELEWLAAKFSDDIDRLGAMTGRNLAHWKSLPRFDKG